MIDVPDLPRTNHDLAQDFGAVRHLERRATGRKMASPAMVVRAAVRMVALLATRDQPLSADDRAHATWRFGRRCASASLSATSCGAVRLASVVIPSRTSPPWKHASSSRLYHPSFFGAPASARHPLAAWRPRRAAWPARGAAGASRPPDAPSD